MINKTPKVISCRVDFGRYRVSYSYMGIIGLGFDSDYHIALMVAQKNWKDKMRDFGGETFEVKGLSDYPVRIQ